MAQNTAYVAATSPVAETGGVLWAPLGTALPTDATTPLNLTLYTPLGYVSEDGLQYSGEAATTEDVAAWGGDTVATLNTAGSIDRRTFKLLEVLNPDVLGFVFGESNVTVTPATTTAPTKIAITDKGAEPPQGVFIFEMFTSKGTKIRRCYPIAQPAITDEDPLVHSALGGYEIQITGFKDTSGNRSYTYHALNDQLAA
jgi:hypothetical protein